MRPILEETDREALLDYLSLVSRVVPLDVEKAAAVALASVRYYKGDDSARAELRRMQELEGRWYRSLENGGPDYSVYEDPYYASDLWACWIVYSRKYLRALQNAMETLLDLRMMLKVLPDHRRVGDLGCGMGYTTAALKELFSQADVYGTQIETSFQHEVARVIALERNFRVVPRVEPDTDVIFASEYFEHFEKPIEHLYEVLEVSKPQVLIVANAFGARSIGHFDIYYDRGFPVVSSAIGKIFNSTLREAGYRQVPTKFWNNRPAVWSRA